MRTELPIVVLDPTTALPVGGASCVIIDRATSSSVTIFSAETGSTTISQPLITDSSGRITGWIDRSRVQITITIPGRPSYIEYYDSAPAGDGGIDTNWLADGAITAAKILDGTVGTAELASGAVDSTKIASTLKPSGSASTSTEALRAIGPTANTVVAGNDSKLTDNRTPIDGSVTLAKLASAVSQLLTAPGMIMMWPKSTPPSGYLFCDGSTQLIVTYPTLAALLGTAFGGNGTTTFGLPNFNSAVPIGAGARSGFTTRTLGGFIGAETHSHTGSAPDHLHLAGSLYVPDHSHGVSLGVSLGTATRGSFLNNLSTGGQESLAYASHVHSGSASGNTGGANTGNSGLGGASGASDRSLAFTTSASATIQPSLGINFIIKT